MDNNQTTRVILLDRYVSANTTNESIRFFGVPDPCSFFVDVPVYLYCLFWRIHLDIIIIITRQ